MHILHVKHIGKMETFIVVALILLMTILTNYYKELFVEPDGKIEIFGNLGFILAIGLLYRWKYIRQIVSMYSSLVVLVMVTALIVTKTFSLSFVLLLIGLGIIFYLTTFSKPVKEYLGQKQN